MKRFALALRATCGLSAALLLLAGGASTAAPPKCEFFGFTPVDPGAKGVAGEKLAFRLTLTHPDSQYFGQTVSVSATVDWGDGAVETTSPRNFALPFGTPYFEGKLEHAYAKPGKFVVKVLRGTANGQVCPLGFAGWAAAYPLTVTVTAGVAQAKAVHALPGASSAAAQKRLVALPTPTPAPVSATAQKRRLALPTPTPPPLKTYSISK